MTSNAERREQVLWQMVSYLQGVVDATIGDEPSKRVDSAVCGFYDKLDALCEHLCDCCHHGFLGLLVEPAV